MKFLFNLASYHNSLIHLSKNDVGVAMSMMTRICLDNGFPVKPIHYDPNLSFEHGMVFQGVKDYVESKLVCVHTTDYATLTHLGNLQFQLTLFNQS